MLAKGGWDKFTVLYAEHCVILNLSSDVFLWLDLEAELWVKQTGLTVNMVLESVYDICGNCVCYT